jgi:hypothetical protein
MTNSARLVKILKGGRIAEAGQSVARSAAAGCPEAKIDPLRTFLPCQSGVESIAKGVRALLPPANRVLTTSSRSMTAEVESSR